MVFAKSSVAILFLAICAQAQLVNWGPCPNVTVKEDFDVKMYVGKWYQAAKYTTIFEPAGRCVTINFTLDNNIINVTTTEKDPKTGIETTVDGRAAFSGPMTVAKLMLTTPSFFNIPVPYWVLDTDYENFTVLYTCSDVFGWFNLRSTTILVRDTNTTMENAYTSLSRNKIDRMSLNTTLQHCDGL